MENQMVRRGQVEGTKWKTRRYQRSNQNVQKGNQNISKW
jgi:hypothetical protein